MLEVIKRIHHDNTDLFELERKRQDPSFQMPKCNIIQQYNDNSWDCQVCEEHVWEEHVIV